MTPAQVRDSAAVGSVGPRIIRAEVTKTGPGVLSWSAVRAQASSWLSISPSSGTVPTTVTATLSPVGLSAGVHRDTVVVTAGGASAAQVRVPVEFTVFPCRVVPLAPNTAVQDSLTDRDCAAPNRSGHFAKLYSFAGTSGDSVSVRLTSSVFDAYLVVDSSSTPVGATFVETDACGGSTGDACLTYLLLRRSDTHLIEATSAAAGEVGAFTLRLNTPRAPAVPTGLAQLRADSASLVGLGGSVPDSIVVLRGLVTDPDSTDRVRLEVEVRPIGTPFAGTPTDSSAQVPAGTTAFVRLRGGADDTDYHWQARTTDETGRSGDWVAYGGNGEAETDFRIATPQPPAEPVALGQFRGDQTTVVPVGGVVPEQNLVFKATLSDVDQGDQLRLEVEVRPVGVAFTGTPTGSSVAVATGQTASATIAGFDDDTAYRWRARAVDAAGLTSGWVSFGNNPETDADFAIAVPEPPVAPTALAQLRRDSTTSVALGDTLREAVIVFRGAATDPDPGAQVRLQVEVRPVGQPFSNVPTDSGAFVATGSPALVVTTGLTDDRDFHWQSRAVDETGRASAWTPFGGNSENDTDFRVQLPATQLSFSTQPSAVVVGTPISPAVRVQIRKASGAVDVNFAGPVTVALAAGTGTSGAVLGGTRTQNAASGTATFSDLTVDRVGQGYRLTATADTLPPATSGTFDVTPGSGATVALVTQPSGAAQSGVPFARQPVVEIRDAGGNPVPQAGVTISASVASGPIGATLSGTMAVTGSDGRATFSGLAISGPVGTYTLSFTGPGLSGATSETITLSSSGAAILAIVTQPSSTAQSGVPFAQQPVIQVQDAAGNPVAQSGISVGASIFSGGGTLSGTTPVATDVDGRAVFTDLAIVGVAGDRVLVFAASGLTSTSPSGTISLSAGGATQLTITTQPSATAQSGVAFARQPAVQLRDASGNVVAQAGVTVTASIATGGGTLGGTPSATTNSSGVAAFTDLRISGSVGDRTLGLSAAGLLGVTTDAITITPGAATQLGIVTQPPTVAQSGVPFGQQPVIQVLDGAGNAVSQSGVVVTAAIATGGGTLGGTVIATTNAGGTASFTNLSITGSEGSRTLSFAAPGLGAVTSNSISITAGAPGQLTIETQPSATAQSGVVFPQQPVLQLRDAAGNPVSQSGVVVTAAIGSGGGILGGTPTATTNTNGAATFVDLSITGIVGTRTLSFTATGLTGATSSAINVTAGTATQLTLTTQPSATAQNGIAFAQQPVVQLRDASGNAVSQSGVTIAASLATTPGGTPTLSNATATTSASGVATFVGTAITGQVGAYTLTFSSGVLSTTTSNTVTLTAGAATQLTVTTQPSATVQSGVAFPQQPAVQLRDGAGNAVSQSGVVVTAAIASGGGALGGTLTVTTNASGVATFANLTITGTIGARTLSFAVTGLTGATSSTITVTAGTATQLSITTQPSATVQSGVAFPQQPAIQLRDGAGNAVSQSGVVVTAAIASGGGALGGTLTATTNASGVATFANLTITGTIGARTLSFAVTGLTGATSSTITVTASTATQLSITTQPSATVRSGVAFPVQPVVQVRDASGNPVSQSGVVVTAAIATGGGSLGGGLTATTNASGVATFANLSIAGTLGSRTLRFTATGLTAAVSNPVDVTPGLPVALSLTVQPSSNAQSGVAFPQQPVVQLRDGSSNAVSEAGRLVTAVLASGSGTLGGAAGVVTDASGAATFSNLSITGSTGAYTVRFEAVPLTVVTSNTITLGAGTGSKLALTTAPSATVQNSVAFPQQPVVQLQDASGNPVSQAGVTVVATILSGGGSLLGMTGVATNAGGAAVFPDLAIQGTIGTRRLIFAADGYQSVSSGDISVTVGVAAQLAVTTQPSTTVQSGVVFAQQPVVRLLDVSGNAVAQSGVAVTAAIATGAGTLDGTLSATTNASGVGAFTNLLIAGPVGNRTLGFSASGLAGTTSNAVSVTAAASATAVSSSVNPSTFGQAVAFSATVTSPGGTPNGTVQFKVDAVNLGAPVALAAGVATSPTTTTLAVGTRTITAEYSGSADFLVSTGTLAGGQVVNVASTTTTVSSSVNPSTFGQSVQFTATVTSSGGTPAGTVQFKVDAANLGTPGTLISGSATSPATTTLAVGTRTITAEYTPTGGNFAASTGTLAGGQVVNAPPTVSLSVDKTTLAELGTDNPATVTATLSGPSGLPVTVNLGFGGTAAQTTDYTRSGTQIAIAAGATTGTVTVSAVNDNAAPVVEGAETVTVSLGVLTNATAGTPASVQVTITDDDVLPTVRFSVAGQSNGEGVTPVTATVQLSAAYGVQVAVPFTVGGGSTAVSPADYSLSTPSPLTIAAGVTNGTITLTVVDDPTNEPNETVILNLGAPTNATLTAPTTHTVTITDNDPLPAAPVITAPTDGSVTNDNTPTVTGTAQANALVEVFDGVSSLGTTTANGAGAWALTTGTLADGAHSLTATATTAAGTGPASAVRTFTVDTQAPAAPVITAPTNGSTTNDNTPTITGTAEANASVA
ncbi:MAG: Ig-like domain repeat protein, partial [Gemmatimonadota bacterium]|nr:Ig-like domain repeat protein [Gemmatimonadota bacterium]